MKFLRKFFQRTSIFLLLTNHLISFIQFFSYSRAVSPALSCTIFFRNIDQFSCTVFLNLYEKFLRQDIFSIQICHVFSPLKSVSVSALFISAPHPARETAIQISIAIKTFFLKSVTNPSVYSIKETRPHKKSRFVHQFIPKGYNRLLNDTIPCSPFQQHQEIVVRLALD